MTPALPAGAVVLAHHPLVDALPVIIPAGVLTGAFGLIVWSDRRRARREREQAAATGQGTAAGQGTATGQGTMDGCRPDRS